MLPGLCAGDLGAIEERVGAPAERGPADLRDLPEYFGQAGSGPSGYGAYDIAILGEINNAPRLSREQILSQARRYSASGADVIDLGCDGRGCGSPSTALNRVRWKPR